MSTIPDDSNAVSARRLRAELGFMFELCQIVASNSELQPILDWIVQKTTGMFEADEGSIRLLNEQDLSSAPVTRVRKEQPGLQSGPWPKAISSNAMGFLMAHGEPLATADITNDPRFTSLKQVETSIRSVLAVPLRVDNRYTGMLAVTARTPGRQWTRD
jgi:GAF domain-containing protein